MYRQMMYRQGDVKVPYLDEPHVVVAVHVVGHHPGRQDVPLHGLAPVHADAQLRVLILAGLGEGGGGKGD